MLKNSHKRGRPLELSMPGKRLLLHACCAPCSSAIIECLVNQGIRPVIFYSNSNIFPLDEYDHRKNECIRYAAETGLEIMIGMPMTSGAALHEVLNMSRRRVPGALNVSNSGLKGLPVMHRNMTSMSCLRHWPPPDGKTSIRSMLPGPMHADYFRP